MRSAERAGNPERSWPNAVALAGLWGIDALAAQGRRCALAPGYIPAPPPGAFPGQSGGIATLTNTRDTPRCPGPPSEPPWSVRWDCDFL